ncbi:hypothetical protein Tco_0436805 [Tanacetum coccineum]
MPTSGSWQFHDKNHGYSLPFPLRDLKLMEMVANLAVIVAEKLYLATLTHVQLFLIEDMLETLVVSINNALHPIQVVTLDLESEYNCTQFQIIGGVILFVNLQLSRGICNHFAPLHQYAPQALA